MSVDEARGDARADTLRYYGQGRESGRLERGLGLLEHLRTRRLLERILPAAPATIWDVGGAMGVYAFWLAERGYQVHLVDLTPLHIAQARMEALRCPDVALASIAVGDARGLDAVDDSADVVMLMGPLYHLTEADERMATLREAKRVLKPGGLIVATAISRYASTMAGFSLGWHADADYRAMCELELSEGQHCRPASWPRLFARAYFHTPAILVDEVQRAGFRDADVVSIEGMGWLSPDIGAILADDASREGLLAMIRTMEHDPVALAVGPHMLATARKPEVKSR